MVNCRSLGLESLERTCLGQEHVVETHVANIMSQAGHQEGEPRRDRDRES